MGISHTNINCATSEFDEVVAFYIAALKPLGYREMMRPIATAVGLGNGFGPDFWIHAREGCDKVSIEARKEMGVHFAFSAKDHPAVHGFHAAALEAGGTCNGKPGYRPQYFKYYYGSFVLDPLGNNVEAVCMSPAWTQLWWWRSWLPGWKGLEMAEKKVD